MNDGGENTPYDIRAEIGATPGSGKDLVIAGFMTHMCVNYTSQGAFNLGYRPTVVAETTATRALTTPDGAGH